MGNLPHPQMVWILWGNGKQTLDEGNLHKLFLLEASLGSALACFSLQYLQGTRELRRKLSKAPNTENKRDLERFGIPWATNQTTAWVCTHMCPIIYRTGLKWSIKKEKGTTTFIFGGGKNPLKMATASRSKNSLSLLSVWGIFHLLLFLPGRKSTVYVSHHSAARAEFGIMFTAHMLFWQPACIPPCFHPLKEPGTAEWNRNCHVGSRWRMHWGSWLCDASLWICWGDQGD